MLRTEAEADALGYWAELIAAEEATLGIVDD